MTETSRQIAIIPQVQTFEHPLDLILVAARDLLPDVVEITTNRAVFTFRQLRPGQLVAPSISEESRGAA